MRYGPWCSVCFETFFSRLGLQSISPDTLIGISFQFFCALPAAARPHYAKRMSDLLNPDGGRLVCLEWPLDKDPSTGGPPWGVSGDLYLAHLGHPGQELPYDDKGRVMNGSADTTPGALKRLARIQPTCTHKAGCDDQGNVIDRVSVWSHQ